MLCVVRALQAFDQHLHGAVGQLQHLQDASRRSRPRTCRRLGLVLAGGLLGDQHDLAAGFHRGFERLDRLGAADEQRNHHVREDDDVAQRQQRQRDRLGGQDGMTGHWGTSLSQADDEARACDYKGASAVCWRRAGSLPNGERRAVRASGADFGRLSVDEQRLGFVLDRCARRPRPWRRRRASAARTSCRSATVPGSSAARARRSCGRAPCVAIAASADGRISSSTPSIVNSFWYCLTSAFFGSVRICTSASSVSSPSVATTGRRPTSSGIRPNLIRSSGSTSRNTSETRVLDLLCTVAPKPMPGLLGAVAG